MLALPKNIARPSRRCDGSNFHRILSLTDLLFFCRGTLSPDEQRLIAGTNGAYSLLRHIPPS